VDPAAQLRPKVSRFQPREASPKYREAVEADLKAEPAMMLVEEILGWLKPYIK